MGQTDNRGQRAPGLGPLRAGHGAPHLTDFSKEGSRAHGARGNAPQVESKAHGAERLYQNSRSYKVLLPPAKSDFTGNKVLCVKKENWVDFQRRGFRSALSWPQRKSCLPLLLMLGPSGCLCSLAVSGLLLFSPVLTP